MTIAMPICKLQRSHGVAAVTFAQRNGVARLVDMAQSGSAKVILPQSGSAAAPCPEMVFLNTSGGLTGGDTLSYQINLGCDVRAVGTTQTAERIYRSTTGVARVSVVATVGANGWLDWLPQETILFQSSALHRNLRIDLGKNAGCLMVESIILGRTAMGEVITDVALHDPREVWRGTQPVLIDPFGLTGDALAPSAALLGGAKAVASMAFITQGAQDALPTVRAVLDQPGVQAAASGWDGKLTLRLMAADGWPMRRQILRVLAVLRPGQSAPRVWQL